MLQPFAWVELHGLSSPAGQKLNGQRGELQTPPPPDDQARWDIRLFDDGRIVRAKPDNISLTAGREQSVVKVGGADGSGFGVMVYKSWTAYARHTKATPHDEQFAGSPPSDNGTYVVAVEFANLDEVPALKQALLPDEALRRRLRAPLGKRKPSGVHGTALLYGLSANGQQPLTHSELLLAEAGLFAAVQFLRKLHPSPPPPYFAATRFVPCTEAVSVDIGGTHTRQIAMQCSFPSGNVLAPHRNWKSYPGIVSQYAPRPNSVKTIADAVEITGDRSYMPRIPCNRHSLTHSWRFQTVRPQTGSGERAVGRRI